MGSFGDGGGAAAAAADLAKAREAVGAGSRNNAEIRSAGEVFRDIDVVIRAVRTYGDAHPRVSDFIDRLHQRLSSHLQQFETLTALLQPRAVLVDSELVFETERIDQNPWFPLFADGVRQILFDPGLSLRETADLCGVLRRRLDSPDAGVEEDAVTMLWESDLPHVTVIAVDSFVRADDDDRKRTDALNEILGDSRALEMPDSTPTARRASRTGPHRDSSQSPPSETLHALHAERLCLAQELPTSARSVIGRLSEVQDAHIAHLRSLCEIDQTYPGRYFGALVAALASRGASSDGPLILECLRELCLRLIAAGDARKAHQMLLHLARAVPDVEEIAAFLIPDEAVGRLVQIVIRNLNTEREQDALGLIAAMSPKRATKLLSATSEVDDPAVRRRLFQVALRWGVPTVQSAGSLLPDTVGVAADELLALLVDSQIDAANAAIAAGIGSQHPSTSAASLRTYFSVAPHAESLPHASRALRAPDEESRRLALDFVVGAGEARAAGWIQRVIRDDRFSGFDLEERRRFYRAFAQLGGTDAGRWCLEQLEQRNPLGRARLNEERILAAFALGELRYDNARPLLERVAGARLSRRDLKRECSDALAMLGRPPGPPPKRLVDPASVEPSQPAQPAGKPRRRTRAARPTDMPAFSGLNIGAPNIRESVEKILTDEEMVRLRRHRQRQEQIRREQEDAQAQPPEQAERQQHAQQPEQANPQQEQTPQPTPPMSSAAELDKLMASYLQDPHD